MSVLRSVIEFLVSFLAFVNFSNVYWFSVNIKVNDWVEKNFFSLTVFGGNLFSSVTMDRHVKA